jgi:hypothetical protein
MPIDWSRSRAQRRKEKAAYITEPTLMFFWNVASACRSSIVHKVNKENGIVSDAEKLWGDPYVLIGYDPGFDK